MYYAAIKQCDIANGPGVRTSLFVSGCRNHCPGCFQPETWDFKYGREYTHEVEQEILDSLEPAYVAGFTVLGGEPFEEENQEAVLHTLKCIRERYPKKSLWAFTGYVLEDLQAGGRKHTCHTDELLSCLDVLVDGRFVEAKKNLMLRFRGSENQRLIDMKKTLEQGSVIQWND